MAVKKKEKKLTQKQRLFVAEYLVSLNATKAAIDAGYSKKTAQQTGSENLLKPLIADAIQEAMDKRCERIEITADRVLQELACLAFLDPRQFYNESGQLIPIHQLPEDVARALSGFEVSTVGGNEITVTSKIKHVDKKASLELCMRHLKMLTDKTELTGKDGAELNLGPKRTLARLAKEHDTAPGGV